MKHDVNLGNVQNWRSQSNWGKEETERLWTMRGRIQPNVRSSHVDIYGLWRAAMYIVIVAAVVGGLFVTGRVLQAVLSGRVHQVLETIQRSH
jgi:hypothetical protein